MDVIYFISAFLMLIIGYLIGFDIGCRETKKRVLEYIKTYKKEESDDEDEYIPEEDEE